MMISRLNASSLEEKKKKRKKHLCPNCRSMHLGKEQLEKSGAEVAFTIDRMLLPLEHADGKLSISQALARSRESPYKGNSDRFHCITWSWVPLLTMGLLD